MLKEVRIYALATFLLIGFGIAFGQLSPVLIQQKLHPTFQAVVTSDGQNLLTKFGGRLVGPAVTLTNGKVLFDAIVTTTNPDAIRAKGIHVNSAFGRYATAQVTREDILSLIQLSDVQYVDPGTMNYPTLDRGLPETGANLLHAGFLNNTSYKGRGVIVLIYDTGIDWRHLDFRDPVDTTKSRILAIWDQTISPLGGETNPSGFSYGVEYTKQQIENEFTVSPPRYVREKDSFGHGTHVAGIAAGNGNSYNKKYVGVAPEADIIVVKGSDGPFTTTKEIDGLTYAQNKAAYFGKAIVVNMSIGGQYGPHDGTGADEIAVDNFSTTPGRSVVISAGNDGGRNIHTSGVVSPSSPATFTLNVPSYTPTSGTNNDAFSLYVCLSSNTSVTSTVVSPSGVTYTRNAGEYGTSANDLDGTIYLENYINYQNGLRYVYLYVRDQSATVPKSGNWTITVSGASTSTSYDAWLSSWTVGNATVTLVGGNNQKTVSMPGTSISAVTVASYVTKNQWPTYAGSVSSISTLVGDISSFSSVGPSRDGRQKPDIAAPGEKIASSLSSDVSISSTSSDLVPGFKHQAMQGTSMAAPHVTGAVALLLSLSPTLAAAQIKSILTSTTNTDLFTSSTPNMSWGYGKLDVLRAALKILNPSGTVQRKIYSYDVDGINYAFSPYLTGSTKYAVRFTPSSSGIVTGAELNLSPPANNPITGNGSVVCEVFTNTAGSLGGIPGSRIGSSVSFPFSRLSAATNNFIDISAAGIAVTAGQDYHIVLSAANPLDQLVVRADDGTTAPSNRSSVYTGTRWVNVADPTSFLPAANIRARAIVTTLSNPVPSAPLPLSPANNATGISTSPVLSWSSVSSATSYNLQISTNSSFSPTIANQTGITSTSDTINGLANNTLYYWRVSATNSGGSSPYSSSWSFTTIIAAPGVPTLASPSNAATNVSIAPTLTWNPVTGATYYHLQVSTSASFSSNVVNKDSLTVTSSSVTGLANSSSYYWRALAWNAGGASAYSTPWSFTTIVAAPGVPTLVSPSNGATNVSIAPTLAWSPVAGALYYHLQVSTSATFTSALVDKDSITATSYPVPGLSNATPYYWRVLSRSVGGLSAYSTPCAFTTIVASPGFSTLVSPPNGVTGLPINLTLTWTASLGAATYRLQIATDSNFVATVLNDSTLTSTQRQVGPLSNGSKYYWRVNATNAGGTSQNSTVWNFTTIVAAPPTPTLLLPADASSNLPINMTLSWSASTRATSYRVQVASNPSFGIVVLDDSTIVLTSRSVGPLSNNTLYYWRVRAKNDGGISAFSDPWGFSTIVAFPGIPTLLFPDDSSKNVQLSPTLRWNPADGASAYHVQVSKASAFTVNVVDDTTLTGTQSTIGPLDLAATYFWRVRARNVAGYTTFSATRSFKTLLTTSVEAIGGVVPMEFALSQNYPNPFNPSTSIQFALPKLSYVSLKVYDLLGREVANLVAQELGAGYFVARWWADVPSGTYLYRLQAGDYVETRKLILLK